jgi:formamidopyrimidine-DNA glycosylase
MPELPEVNTIKNQLNEILPLKISKVEKSKVSDSIIHTPMKIKKDTLLTEVKRKGKMLNFLLSDERHLLSHLGMSGSWRISTTKVKEKHTHLQFEGTHKGKKVFLAYVDPRRFGHMYLYNKEDAKAKLDELGVDLVSPEFTVDYLKETIKKYPNRMIKVHLLDQKLYAGSGNYIANEICARASVLPTRLNKDIKPREFAKLHAATAKVLSAANETGGTTFQGGYADTTGSKGGGVQHLVVFYQSICQMCKKTEVEKIYLAKRGTYFCPRCQK